MKREPVAVVIPAAGSGRRMGGLRKYMPHTFRTFIIGSLALAGIFPLAGFWSKDEILAGASQLGGGGNGYPLALWGGIIGGGMTAAYMTRCVYLTFFGEYRGHGTPHESPKAITTPLWILAIISVASGARVSTARRPWGPEYSVANCWGSDVPSSRRTSCDVSLATRSVW